ncbi:MAG: tRNA (adenosine(37)-N6)-threonylcarbamoyltransferase complex transferase subunit TsaD [Clostridiales bacterium]|nr:tRNA (adenosine(37)-N6)-threonylcarbamoyltransferase complex transferase subunit TsaD [Clostridiales bacterium]
MAVLTLGIESSCDETACAVIEDGRIVRASMIASQADYHSQYGGVVPELASRMHVEAIVPCLSEAMEKAGISYDEIDAVCVTKGPGLVGALLVGVSAAKALCEVKGLPLVGVNHMAGHIAANYLSDSSWEPPFLCLVVSGGHSEILLVKDYADMEYICSTRDDAAGEAFDKIARVIGLGYPGGPKMDKESQSGNPHAYSFPTPKIADSLDFSFSGIKTAALNTINQIRQQGGEINVPDFAASYQDAICSVLIDRLDQAIKLTGMKKICLAGGVSANSCLRKKITELADKRKCSICIPKMAYCTDNAAMIASAGYYDFRKGIRDGMDMNAYPSLELGV